MPELPVRIGRYDILGLVGRGAMGVVYRAKDPLIGRTVAIKMVASSAVLPSDSQAEFKERFFREAQTAGNLHHPNIVTIYDLGEEGGVPFMAQEFVEGESLASRLKRGPLPLAEALSVTRQVAEGLAYAHERGVIHRDVKPDNVLLDPKGRAVITDFGIAKVSASELTRTGEVLGTPTFMSPEQVKGEELDPRSDLFSLGVVLYTMVSGQKPFKGDTISSVCYQVVHADPRPSVAELSLPEPVSGILKRLLAKRREERYASADDLLADLGASFDRTLPAGSQSLRRVPSPAEHDQTVPASGAIRARGRDASGAAAPPAAAPPPSPTVAAPSPPSGKSGRRWILAGVVALAAVLVLAGLAAAGFYLKHLRAEAAAQQVAAAPPPAAPAQPPPQAASSPEGQPRPSAAKPAGEGTSPAPASKAAPPERPPAQPASLLFVALGPLTMGQVQVDLDGKSVLHVPMVAAENPRGGEGFLNAERLDIAPGPHDLRVALAAASPGPFYAESSKRVVMERTGEQVIVAKALRFPARVQLSGPVARGSLPAELQTALSERLSGEAAGEAPSGPAAAQALLRGEGGAPGAGGGPGMIHILMDAPVERGEIRLYLDGSLVANHRLEELPRPFGKPGFHLDEKVATSAGTHTLRAVLAAPAPRPFEAEGSGSFALQDRQHLRLRIEIQRFPPRLTFVDMDR